MLTLLCAAHSLFAQTDRGAKVTTIARDTDSSTLLSPLRIAALSPSERAAWTAYVERSSLAQQQDRALLDSELVALGKTTMQKGAFLSTSFNYEKPASLPVMSTDSVRRMADAMLSYQTPSGGWSKHIDFNSGPRAKGQSFFSENDHWQYIATIDNDATTSEMRFLMRAVDAGGRNEYKESVVRGVRYLLDAQFPNGCWPQVWPLQGGYHDAATFNDDAIVEVLQLLDEVAHGALPYVSNSLRQSSAKAVSQGIRCILAAQMRVDGQLTVWGQQHDPLTLDATNARSYELRSLTSKESAGVIEFLMDHSESNSRIKGSVDAAIGWLNRTAIHEMRSVPGVGLVADASAGPVWARMYEIGTNRPIFSNRDGKKLYTFEELTDRRDGYGWYATEPARVIKHYREWAHLDAPKKKRTP